MANKISKGEIKYTLSKDEIPAHTFSIVECNGEENYTLSIADMPAYNPMGIVEWDETFIEKL